LEILDFENCDFVQYRPATTKLAVPFGPCTEDGAPPDQVPVDVPEIFMVTRVIRDRAWFEGHLPVMQRFWDGVVRAREKGLCEVEWDETAVPKCEVTLDEDGSESRLEVSAQAQVSHVQGVHGDLLCEVYSARNALLSRAG
jgi:hypothetical protein